MSACNCEPDEPRRIFAEDRANPNPHMSWCPEAKAWAEQQRVAKLLADTRYEGHKDALAYGWWERKPGGRVLPATLKDPRNYVLTYDELRRWHADLIVASEQITEQRARVHATIKALEGGSWRSWTSKYEPTCFTLAHALEYMLIVGKQKLASMEWLLAMTGARKDTLVRVPNQQQGDANEDTKGAA